LSKSKKARVPARSRAKKRLSPRNKPAPVRQTSANSGSSEKPPKKLLTSSSGKPGPRSRLFGNTLLSAEHAYGIFSGHQGKISLDALSTADSLMHVEAALWEMDEPARPYVLRRWGAAILLWAAEKKRPKQKLTAIYRHLADSIAGEGNVSPRRSRDICDRLRRQEIKASQIVRREFHVKCSCGYEGPAFRDACPKCGASVALFELRSGFGN
jgi:hypothetical protein